MKKLFLMSALLSASFIQNTRAQEAKDWLPQSGVKSPYAPLAMPTTLKPVQTSLARLLSEGYRITTTTNYANSGALFTLAKGRQTILCALTAPIAGTDQNVPTSRCWSLNEPLLTNYK